MCDMARPDRTGRAAVPDPEPSSAAGIVRCLATPSSPMFFLADQASRLFVSIWA